jgi:transcriptional regulator with XRE-family HTH domain
MRQKLTPDQIEAIMEDRKTQSIYHIALKYGVSPSYVSLLCRGKRNRDQTALDKLREGRYPLTDGQIEELKRDYQTTTLKELADRFGVKRSIVKAIGREVIGIKRNHCKLTAKEVNQIVELSQDYTNRYLAMRFDTSISQISRILHGKTRFDDLTTVNKKRVGPALDRKNTRLLKIKPDQITEILKDRNEKLKKLKEIAAKYGVSITTISTITKKK